MNSKDPILATVTEYYTNTVVTHGATPRGVDWNSEESQYIRFGELSRIFASEVNSFSLLDYGTGWGAMLDYLRSQQSAKKISFTGYDIVPEMISHALQKHPSDGEWKNHLSDDDIYDYTVASGIFNVRKQHSDSEWLEYIHATLKQFDKVSSKGFAFNMLTSYSDADKMRDYLYYADPCAVFDYCKRHFSRSVSLLHDYHLYEFTILVKK